jgi:hypothetical protein
MPILSPLTRGPLPVVFKIQDLENEVLLRTENHVTDISRTDIWLRDALLEITSNPDFRNEFDLLEEYGPLFNLTPPSGQPPVGTQEYDFNNIVPVGDYNVSTLDVLIWQDPPTNSIRRKLGLSHYQKADNFQPTFSLPTEWYRFADTIGFTPVPDKAYQIQARILRQHPINDNQLNQTQILIPREWNEILVWMAVERGFMEYLEYEKATKVHILLYGDPKHPDRVGLFEGRKKRREMEAHRTETPLRPVYRKMMWGA